MGARAPFSDPVKLDGLPTIPLRSFGRGKGCLRRGLLRKLRSSRRACGTPRYARCTTRTAPLPHPSDLRSISPTHHPTRSLRSLGRGGLKPSVNLRLTCSDGCRMYQNVAQPHNLTPRSALRHRAPSAPLGGKGYAPPSGERLSLRSHFFVFATLTRRRNVRLRCSRSGLSLRYATLSRLHSFAPPSSEIAETSRL